MEGLEALLTEELGIHTIIANPFKSMSISEGIDQEELDKTAPQYMVAAGLALRSFVSWHL